MINALKPILHQILNSFSPALCLRVMYLARHGRLLDLRNPNRFSDIIQREKLVCSPKLLSHYADKNEAKRIVSSKLGAEWVTPTYWTGPELPPLNHRNWPIPYVIKPTHSSGACIFIRRVSDIDWPTIESEVQHWKQSGVPGFLHERHYDEITPAIIVEPFLGSDDILPLDYKIFCFGGAPNFIQIDFGRESSHTRSFYDLNWKPMDMTIGFPAHPALVEAPSCLSEMVCAAAQLAQGFSFVRVDFYDIGNRPRFGEFTFFPGSGLEKISPLGAELDLGSRWPVR